MRRLFAVVAVAGGIAGNAAFAGEQYVDGSGYAVSGFDVVAYFNKSEAAAGNAPPAPTPGRADITA